MQKEADAAREKQAQRAAKATEPVAVAARSNVPPVPKMTPPFWGPRVLDRVAVEDVAAYLDRNALFRGRWGGVAHGEEYETAGARAVRATAGAHAARGADAALPAATRVYGYFPVRVEGDELLVLDPDGQTREIERFPFPRQPDGERLCLADYFVRRMATPAVAGFQVVTMGERASAGDGELQAAGDYSEAYFLHGLSVQMAEAMADYVNARINRELGLGEGEAGARRYSWGYAAIPELADHERVFRLLGVPEAIGVTLTESYQLVPEQSTAAIVVPHPQATYFAVRA